MTLLAAGQFSARIIDWQRQHGRHGLPWQGTSEPYRVWLSEIMLQQTQVSTVLDYYPRFLARFPDVQALAAAAQDEVLGLWSGLGYYSRARNLHACAQAVVARFGGHFPSNAADLQTLPGIGRSTAAAVASFCFGERVAILDGNVKRVLTRVFGFGDDLSVAANEKALWQLAESLLPTHDVAQAMPRYTQGMMDLGATLCTLRRPACTACPMVDACVAACEGRPTHYPVKTRRLRRSHLDLWLLHVLDEQGRVWLHPRPDKGIWAGLWCLPQYPSEDALLDDVPARARSSAVWHDVVQHVLTHRDLSLHLATVQVRAADWGHAEGAWFDQQSWGALGLPAPVRRFLEAQAPLGLPARA